MKRCTITKTGETLELIDSPVKTMSLPWTTLLPGQGHDGYGRKITMPYKVDYNGRKRRLYCTQISNAGSFWFMNKGKKIFVS